MQFYPKLYLLVTEVDFGPILRFQVRKWVEGVFALSVAGSQPSYVHRDCGESDRQDEALHGRFQLLGLD